MKNEIEEFLKAMMGKSLRIEFTLPFDEDYSEEIYSLSEMVMCGCSPVRSVIGRTSVEERVSVVEVEFSTQLKLIEWE